MSSSIAFKLAKMVGRSPIEIAKKLAAGMKGTSLMPLFKDVNGYVNAFFDEKKYSGLVLRKVLEEKKDYGKSEIGGGRRVIVEFPSVNPAHPWHVGHVRNALLGDAISNLQEFCSYEVEREDYIDDLGLQVATALWGWFNISNKPDKKFDQWLGELYVKANKEMEKEEVKKEVEAILKKLEDAETKESKAGREMAEKCVMAQQETAFSYGIYHDVMIWESDIVRAKLLNKALALAADKNILEKPEEGKYKDATVVKLEKITKYAKELEGSREDAKVIIRSNGAATYIAKDFAFHTWKFGLIDAKFNFREFIEKQPNGKPIFTTAPMGSQMNFGNVKKAINIIDSGQAYEQLIMKVMFSLIDHEEISNNLVHLSYGKVSIEGEKISGREGNWLGEERNYTADDLLRETKERALGIASKSEKITNKEEIDSIANAIALSAIKFEYLRMAPERAMVFSWKSALDFEGNSGLYVMYTYARSKKILKRVGYIEAIPDVSDFEKMTRGYDFELVKMIGDAQEIIEKACEEARPNVITDYLLEISSLFSKFYETMPVIKGEDAKNVRLALVCALGHVIENMLLLLGITTVNEM
jgi:arginyl-tRNA synthetase